MWKELKPKSLNDLLTKFLLSRFSERTTETILITLKYLFFSILLVIVAILFSLQTVLMKIVQNQESNGLVFTSVRCFIAFIIITPVTVVVDGGFHLHQLKHLPLFITLGFLQIFAAPLTFTFGVFFLGPPLTSLYSPAMSVITFALSVLFCIEKLRFRGSCRLVIGTYLKLIGLLATVLGAVTIILYGILDDIGRATGSAKNSVLGNLLLIVNVIVSALNLVLAKKFIFAVKPSGSSNIPSKAENCHHPMMNNSSHSISIDQISLGSPGIPSSLDSMSPSKLSLEVVQVAIQPTPVSITLNDAATTDVIAPESSIDVELSTSQQSLAKTDEKSEEVQSISPKLQGLHEHDYISDSAMVLEDRPSLDSLPPNVSSNAVVLINTISRKEDDPILTSSLFVPCKSEEHVEDVEMVKKDTPPQNIEDSSDAALAIEQENSRKLTSSIATESLTTATLTNSKSLTSIPDLLASPKPSIDASSDDILIPTNQPPIALPSPATISLYPPFTSLFYVFLYGCIMHVIMDLFVFWFDRPAFFSLTSETWMVLLYCGIFSTFFTFSMMIFSMKYVSASMVAIFLPFQIFLILILSFFFFGQVLSIVQLSGGFILITGLGLVTFGNISDSYATRDK